MDNKKFVTVTLNGMSVSAAEGQLLSEIFDMETPCGGHGKCGKCKVKAKGMLSPVSKEEKRLLSKDELAEGVRLACLTRVMGDAEAEILSEKRELKAMLSGSGCTFELLPSFKGYGIAVDIGTTTVASRLYDESGMVLREDVRLNPQSKWGADVISRVEAALDGKAELLKEALADAVSEAAASLTKGLDINKVDLAVITGNTVMLTLLAGQSAEPFSHAPFKAERLFGEYFTAEELALSCLPSDTSVYLAPCISAFVGGDLVCAVLASGLCEGETAVLADVGTNGELALWHNDRLTVCSTAAGPAFEGVGISMGMRGEAGAVDRVSIVNGRAHAHVIGEGKAAGICGSGLIDAAAVMLRLSELDESGYLEDDPFVVCGEVKITGEDVRMLQLAKSALCAGILTLAERAGLKASGITRLYVAGGFGNYLNVNSAKTIGLFPASLADRSVPIGNAALSGGAMLLLNRDMREKAEQIAKSAAVIELSTDPVFSENYINGMIFKEI